MHRILTSDRASAVALLNYILDFLFLLTPILPFCLSPRFGFFLSSLHRVCLRTGVCRWLLSDARNNEAFPFCANYFWVFRLLILVLFFFFRSLFVFRKRLAERNEKLPFPPALAFGIAVHRWRHPSGPVLRCSRRRTESSARNCFVSRRQLQECVCDV